MYSKVFSVAVFGMSAFIVNVETDVGFGLPSFEMSGELSVKIKESKERIRAAIKNSGIELNPQRILVNISPADIKKDTTGFDLPIAAGILMANKVLDDYIHADTVIIGELSLDGHVNPVRGILPCVCMAREKGFKRCIIPYSNLSEANIVSGIEIVGVSTLIQLIDFLKGNYKSEENIKSNVNCREDETQEQEKWSMDFADVKGQELAKRATLIAVAGMHNIMYIGSPGSGKTMLARRIPTIMPSLSFEESIELTKIYSIAGLLDERSPRIKKRPFRSPHHNITDAAMFGGGKVPKPGEVTLAGKGVLFLDEMTEYKTAMLEALRQPLEDKRINISRLNYACTYPADFMLAAAMNPCKCGFYPDRNRCNCSENDIQRYIGRISRPVWDRFDINVLVSLIDFSQISNAGTNKNSFNVLYNSKTMKNMVERARKMQIERFKGTDISFNSEMSVNEINRYCYLGKDEKELMNRIYKKMDITARGYHKILKVSRTIADIEGAENICIEHLSEAVSYRRNF